MQVKTGKLRRGKYHDRSGIPSPSFRGGLEAVAHACPWTWVAALFGLQLSGALMVSLGLRLSLREVALPLMLLLLGTVHALVMRLRFRACRLNPGQYWLPALFYALFIFLLSHRSYTPEAPLAFSPDFFHPVEYATLAILLCGLAHPLLLRSGKLPFLLSVLSSGLLFAITDEIHQSFVPGRDPSFFDIGLDLIGLFAGCLIFLVARRIQGSLQERGQS